ncbi:hypothetical protein PG984_015847 [Apiospora sp. TS-2023a]
MGILSDIANNDAAQRIIVGMMLEVYTKTNKPVEDAALLLIHAYGNDPLGTKCEVMNWHGRAPYENSEEFEVPWLETRWALLDGMDPYAHDVRPQLNRWMRKGLL